MRILSPKESKKVLNLWRNGRGATYIKKYCLTYFNKEIARTTVYDYIFIRTYKSRKKDPNCAFCGLPLENHKKCADCRILVHDEPWLKNTVVGLDRGEKCASCIHPDTKSVV